MANLSGDMNYTVVDLPCGIDSPYSSFSSSASAAAPAAARPLASRLACARSLADCHVAFHASALHAATALTFYPDSTKKDRQRFIRLARGEIAAAPILWDAPR
eukprot:scaffold1960_cov242-Pinguiococcus_pyrenoidosus.AAC.3